ncbi:hypothetical protein [Pseudoduganella violaceinigra]|uniref:hypothetical protein n=1 Tax=Pseudoduganella violaceinigra TaxID=246602 RepID=UPI00041B1910|nr:hypothetical protein [Pseudoduganella violaceinigra]
MTRLVDRSRKSFDAVAELLLEHGNAPQGDGWFVDKEGYHLLLTKPIDWKLLYANFTFSSGDIKLDDNSISTWDPAYEIIGGR